MDLTRIYYLNEIGGKKKQEDFIWPDPNTVTLENRVFIVCDGVGGSENGEVASKIIAETVGEGILKMGRTEISHEAINILLSDAREELVNYAERHGLNTDMATTFTMLVLGSNTAYVGWCGDSRIYHIRNGEVLYRTSDHSLVNSLVKSGEITEEEAENHPRRNVILRAIKADEKSIEADFASLVDVQNGDYFMLCTDGLLENITNKDLKFLLKQNETGSIDLIEAFQQFCRGKTRDNYSMYLVKVNIEKKGTETKKKTIPIILGLMVLLIASAFILNPFLLRSPTVNKNSAIAKPKIFSDSLLKKDSVLMAEPVSVSSLSASFGQPGAPLNRENSNDSLNTKKQEAIKSLDTSYSITTKSSIAVNKDRPAHSRSATPLAKDSVGNSKVTSDGNDSTDRSSN